MILVFNVTDHESFEGLKNWYNEVKDYKSQLVVVGNKVDLDS